MQRILTIPRIAFLQQIIQNPSLVITTNHRSGIGGCGEAELIALAGAVAIGGIGAEVVLLVGLQAGRNAGVFA